MAYIDIQRGRVRLTWRWALRVAPGALGLVVRPQGRGGRLGIQERTNMTLAQVRAYALALRETSEEPHFDRTSFRVRGKIFATARAKDSHVHIFIDDAARERALALHPEFVEKLWWGKKVVGVRVALKNAERSAVNELLRMAWLRKAPASFGKPTRGAD